MLKQLLVAQRSIFCHVVLVSKAASSHDICGSTEKLFQETLKGGD